MRTPNRSRLRNAFWLYGLCGLLLLCAASVSAQESVARAQSQATAEAVPDNPNPLRNQTIVVAINVDTRGLQGFDNRLAAYQAILQWDPTILEYQSFTPAPAPWNAPTVVTGNAASGKLEWNQFIAGGVDPAKINLLNVNFNVIGPSGSASAVTLSFAELRTALSSNLLPIQISNGLVQVQPNNPPVLDPIADQFMDAGTTRQVSISASDPEGEEITFSLINNPSFVSLGAGFILLQPGLGDAGTYSNILVVATDNGTPPAADTASFNLTVNPAENPPQLDPIPDQTVNEGDTLSVPIRATDADGDDLTLTFPDTLPFANPQDNHNGTGEIVFTPGFDHAGVYPNITVVVTDDATPPLSATTSFTLTVLNTNRAPVIADGGALSVKEGETLSATLTAGDPDGDAIEFGENNLPDFGTLTDNHNGTASLGFAPGFDDAGNYPNILVIVKDASLSDTMKISLQVVNVNRPPAFTADVDDTTVSEGNVLEFAVTATDPDGDAFALTPVNRPGFAEFMDLHNGTGRFRFAPVVGDAGVYSIAVIAAEANDPVFADTVTFDLTVTRAASPLVCSVEIASPADSLAGCGDSVTVCIVSQVSGGAGDITKTCEVNGITVLGFCVTVPLVNGANTIIAKCTFADTAGNTCASEDTITVFSSQMVCSVAITTPEDSSFVCALSLNVGGTTSVTGGLGEVTSVCTINGAVVSSGGGAFGATVDLVPGSNTIVAACTFTDSIGCSVSCSKTVVVFADTSAPVVTFDLSRNPFITGEVVDLESGIATIEVIQKVNRTVSIDSFEIGDTSVRFSSDRIDPGKRSTFTIKVTNRAGCVIVADPVGVRLEPSGAREDYTFTIPEFEHYLLVSNHGLTRIEAKLNERRVELLATSEGAGREGDRFFIPFEGTRSLDLAEFLVSGENAVQLACDGPEGSYAELLFSDLDIGGGITGVEDWNSRASELPTTFALRQNYPNPFNPETRITFDVPAGWSKPVSLRIYNLQGQMILTLVEGAMPPGTHEIVWNSRDAFGAPVATGVYFYQAASGDFVAVRKMLLAK